MDKTKKHLSGGSEEMESIVEQTIKRIERLNRILTVVVAVELIVLLLFL